MATEARTGARTGSPGWQPAAYPPVRIVAGPAFELIAQLSAFTSGPARPSLESGKTWIRDVRELAGAELIRGVERWSIALYGELASVALEAGPPYRTEQLVRHIRAMKPGLLWQRLIGAESAPNRAMLSRGAFDRAIAGDPAARTEIIDVLGGHAASRNTLERLFATRPELVQAEIAAIVETWARRVFPVFADAALALTARDVEAKDRLFAEVPPREALLVATSGVAFDPNGWATEIVFVPTVALRPFIVPVEWRSTAIILGSVADEAFDDDPAAPPRRLVQAAAALGDALRLRVLHELGDGELTASELADRVGVDRTTLHHHLGILRSAGLVTVRAEGLQSWRYAVRREGIAGVTTALVAYLGQG
jgi:DNA-binding transcriptional ArsR family regulator